MGKTGREMFPQDIFGFMLAIEPLHTKIIYATKQIVLIGYIGFIQK